MDNSQPQPAQIPVDNPVPLRQPESSHKTRAEQQHRKKLILFSIGGAVLTAVLLVGAYFLFLRDGSKQQPAQQTNTQQKEAGQESTEQPTVADSSPQTFKSDKLNIELTHRKDWTLKESSDGAITITSSRISYAGTDGKSKTGVFTVRFRKGASEAQRATIDKSIATRNSEVIAYAAPAEGQRQYTNLSYAGPKDMFGFFIVTGNTEFKAGAPYMYSLPLDGDSYLIVGGYGADTTNSLAFDSVPKDMMDSDALKQAIDIVESLKIY